MARHADSTTASQLDLALGCSKCKQPANHFAANYSINTRRRFASAPPLPPPLPPPRSRSRRRRRSVHSDLREGRRVCERGRGGGTETRQGLSLSQPSPYPSRQPNSPSQRQSPHPQHALCLCLCMRLLQLQLRATMATLHPQTHRASEREKIDGQM